MSNTRFLRTDLAKFIRDPRVIKAFEELSAQVDETANVDVDLIEGEISALNVLSSMALGLIASANRAIDQLATLQAAQAQAEDLKRRVKDLETAVSNLVVH